MGIHSGIRARLPRITAGSKAKGTAAAALLLLAALVPAGAAASPSTVAFGPRAVHDTAGDDWVGYVATGTPGEFTSISGSWTEPQITCTSTNDLYSPWLGLDGWGDSTVEQLGVEGDCSSGEPTLAGWVEMYPAAPVYLNDPVSQGDRISASLVSSGDVFSMTLQDTTQGWSEHVTKTATDAQGSSAEAVLESPTGSFPPFAQFTFSDILVNGEPFADFNPQPVGSAGYGVSPLSGGTFSVTPDVGAHGNPRRAAHRSAVLDR